jgi:hypothetical protein
MSADEISWECARCSVAASHMDGRRAALPTGWTEVGDRTFCLSCSRALAGDEAMDSAPADCSRADLIRLRRAALIEFEIRRSPDTSNQMIARACRTSTGAVTAVRAALRQMPAATSAAGTRRGG